LLLFPSSYLWGGASLPNSTNDEGTNMQLRRVQELMFAANRCRRHLVQPWIRVDVRNYTWFESGGGNGVQQLSASAAAAASLGRISAPLSRFAWYSAPEGWQPSMMEEETAHEVLQGQLHTFIVVSRWDNVPDGPNCRQMDAPLTTGLSTHYRSTPYTLTSASGLQWSSHRVTCVHDAGSLEDSLQVRRAPVPVLSAGRCQGDGGGAGAGAALRRAAGRGHQHVQSGRSHAGAAG
jgi:hypothetical protein